MDIIGEDGFVQEYYPIITPTIEHHSETDNHVDDDDVAQIAANTALLLTQQTKNTEYATILTEQETTNTEFDTRINYNAETFDLNYQMLLGLLVGLHVPTGRGYILGAIMALVAL